MENAQKFAAARGYLKDPVAPHLRAINVPEDGLHAGDSPIARAATGPRG